MDLVLQAQMFATQKHVLDNRQLYGVLPYTHHLAAVHAVLTRYGKLHLQRWHNDGCRCYMHNACGCTTGWQPDEHCGCGVKP